MSSLKIKQLFFDLNASKTIIYMDANKLIDDFYIQNVYFYDNELNCRIPETQDEFVYLIFPDNTKETIESSLIHGEHITIPPYIKKKSSETNSVSSNHSKKEIKSKKTLTPRVDFTNSSVDKGILILSLNNQTNKDEVKFTVSAYTESWNKCIYKHHNFYLKYFEKRKEKKIIYEPLKHSNIFEKEQLSETESNDFINHLPSEIDKLKLDLAKTKEVYEKAKILLSENLKDEIKTLIEAGKEKMAWEEEKMAWEEEKMAWEEEKMAWKEEKMAWEKEKAALHNEKAALQNEKAALQNEKAALQNERKALQNEKAALQNEKKNMQMKIISLETEKLIMEKNLNYKSKMNLIELIKANDDLHSNEQISSTYDSLSKRKAESQQVNMKKK